MKEISLYKSIKKRPTKDSDYQVIGKYAKLNEVD